MFVLKNYLDVQDFVQIVNYCQYFNNYYYLVINLIIIDDPAQVKCEIYSLSLILKVNLIINLLSLP